MLPGEWDWLYQRMGLFDRPSGLFSQRGAWKDPDTGQTQRYGSMEPTQNLWALLTSLGTGMLANNKPGATLGQNLGAGMMYANEQRRADQDDQLRRGMFEMQQQEFDLKRKDYERKINREEALANMFAPPSPAGAQPAEVNAGFQGSPLPAQQSGGLLGDMPPDMVNYYKAYGAADPEAAIKGIIDYRNSLAKFALENDPGLIGQKEAAKAAATLPYDLAKARAGKPETSVTVNGEQIPKPILDAAIKSLDKSDELQAQIDDLNNFQQLAGQTKTGFWEPITLPMRAALQGLGINVGEGDISLQQLMQASQKQIALRFRNPVSGFGLTGNTSNQDREWLMGIGPGLEKTPEANEALLIMLSAKTRRQQQLEQAKADYVFQNGTLAGWNDARKSVVESPLFSVDERARLEEIAAKGSVAGAAFQSGTPQPPQGPLSGAQFMSALPSLSNEAIRAMDPNTLSSQDAAAVLAEIARRKANRRWQ